LPLPAALVVPPVVSFPVSSPACPAFALAAESPPAPLDVPAVPPAPAVPPLEPWVPPEPLVPPVPVLAPDPLLPPDALVPPVPPLALTGSQSVSSSSMSPLQSLSAPSLQLGEPAGPSLVPGVGVHVSTPDAQALAVVHAPVPQLVGT
jgi:hypothetical protein